MCYACNGKDADDGRNVQVRQNNSNNNEESIMNTIDIQLDEKACVGCSLCIDECPTRVFQKQDNNPVPKIGNSKECFGCLSCSEICPATAIHHRNVYMSESYYHDPRTIDLVAKIGIPERTFNIPKDSDHINKALDDLGIRLLSVTSVLKQTLGQSLPSVGTMAGITLASQLPRYQVPQSSKKVMQLLVETFSPAWVMEPELTGDTLTVSISSCFVRDVCNKDKIELGGDLCTLFYNYFAGYLSKIGRLRPKLSAVVRDQKKCIYTVKIHENK
jgi:ferredoxin